MTSYWNPLKLRPTEIIYSPHAVDRLIQRQISTAEVEEVLAKPDFLVKQSQDKITTYTKIGTRTDNSLAVVAVEQDCNIEVITVMVNF